MINEHSDEINNVEQLLDRIESSIQSQNVTVSCPPGVDVKMENAYKKECTWEEKKPTNLPGVVG